MHHEPKTLNCALHTRLVDDNRFDAAIRAVEATLPTEPLVYTVSESARLVRLDDPAAWLKANMLARNPELLCNGNKRVYVELFTRTIAPVFVLEDEPLVFMYLQFPDTPEFAARLPDLVRAIGPESQAYRLDASSGDATFAIVQGAGRKHIPPKSDVLWEPAVPSAVPRYIGWINYWSDASCRLLDFAPDDPRAGAFTHITPIAGHGLMLQLTEEPLDLDRPDHMAALTAAYSAFPAIDQAYGP